GLIVYREFVAAGFERVRLFERDDVPGGNWHYTDETPLDAPIPNGDPVVGGFVPSFPSHWGSLPVEEHYSSGWGRLWREHKGPKPVWESLESNYPAVRGFSQPFDAIVVATGRYNAPNIPNISGLEEWATNFPGSIIHSRQYRRPQPFVNETVLVVGGALSGVEIMREI
ncbi:hypothetical protein B0H14DRAFT_3596068, partial [Mycena olivaceomarginata]